MRLAHAVFLLFSFPTVVSSLIIHIPDDYATIGGGINSAAPGDTVLVSCGVYYESGLSISSDIVILSEVSSPSCVVIDAEKSDQLFWIWSGNVHLEGITLQNGFGWSEPPNNEGGGIHCNGGSLTLVNCILQDCFSDSMHLGFTGCGGGIYTVETSLTLIGCEFINNVSGYGAAVYLWEGSTAQISDCIFAYNNSDHAGGAIYQHRGGLNVTSSIFMRNTVAQSFGGAIAVSDPAYLYVTNSSFIENVANTYGGAMSIAQPSVTEVSGCTFIRNQALVTGGCLQIGSAAPATVSVNNSTFYANQSPEAACIHIHQNETWLILESSIVANSIGEYAIACGETATNLSLSCSNFFGNQGDDWSSCFDVLDGGGVSFEDPHFCDPDLDDFHLNSISVCAPENNDCSVLIGAWPVECSTSIQSKSWSSVKAMY